MRGLSLEVASAALLLTVEMLCTCQGSGSLLHPIILIPGNGGNQLEARLTADYRAPSLLCGRWYPPKKDKDGWFRLWFDASVVVAPFTHCFAHRMTLFYDPSGDDYRNAPGVETRVPHFGSTSSLLYLDPNLQYVTAYMAPLVKSLEQIGYVDGETLFGAPYDFRYGLAAPGHPSHVGSSFLQDLKQLIQNASASNGGKPVILLSHSLGGLYALQLLTRNSPSWARHFIKHLVALSTPWGGTVQQMLTFASGNSLGVPLVHPLLVRAEQRSSDSNLWLLPSPIFFQNKPLVITPNRNYSAQGIPQFLTDIGFPEGVGPYESRILPLVSDGSSTWGGIGVRVTCVIGSGVETAEALVYGEEGGGFDFDRGPEEVVYGDGDGTVNMVSLLGLQMLNERDEKVVVEVRRLPGVSHTSILKDEAALAEIVTVISGINSPVSDFGRVGCIQNASP